MGTASTAICFAMEITIAVIFPMSSTANQRRTNPSSRVAMATAMILRNSNVHPTKRFACPRRPAATVHRSVHAAKTKWAAKDAPSTSSNVPTANASDWNGDVMVKLIAKIKVMKQIATLQKMPTNRECTLRVMTVCSTAKTALA